MGGKCILSRENRISKRIEQPSLQKQLSTENELRSDCGSLEKEAKEIDHNLGIWGTINGFSAGE